MLAQTPQEVNPPVPYIVGMGDTFVISGLREKRSTMGAQIIELRRQMDNFSARLSSCSGA